MCPARFGGRDTPCVHAEADHVRSVGILGRAGGVWLREGVHHRSLLLVTLDAALGDQRLDGVPHDLGCRIPVRVLCQQLVPQLLRKAGLRVPPSRLSRMSPSRGWRDLPFAPDCVGRVRRVVGEEGRRDVLPDGMEVSSRTCVPLPSTFPLRACSGRGDGSGKPSYRSARVRMSTRRASSCFNIVICSASSCCRRRFSSRSDAACSLYRDRRVAADWLVTTVHSLSSMTRRMVPRPVQETCSHLLDSSLIIWRR